MYEYSNRIGGSDVSSILLGYPSTPLGVYLRVVDGVEDESIRFEAELGRLAEPVVRAEVEKEINATITKPTTFLIGDWGRASPDGYVVPNDELDPTRDLWECKLRWPSTATAYGEGGSEEIPEKDMLQVQFYMHALRRAKIDRTRLTLQPVLGRRRTYFIGRNEALGDLIHTKMERFWRDHIVPKRPPPPSTNEELNSAWSGDFSGIKEKDRPLLMASDEAFYLIQDLKQCVLGMKAYAKERKEIEQKLKLLIADNYGISSRLGKITWSSQKGRIDWEEVARAREQAWRLIASAHQIDPPAGTLEEVAEKNRGEDVRVFRTPRGWSDE